MEVEYPAADTASCRNDKHFPEGCNFCILPSPHDLHSERTDRRLIRLPPLRSA
jgi:hypothetical protein